MTVEQKIREVKHALDGHAELIAKFREAAQAVVEEDYLNYSTGGWGFERHAWAHDVVKRAEATLSQAEVCEIWGEATDKYGVGKNPEAWPIYRNETVEQRAPLENEIIED